LEFLDQNIVGHGFIRGRDSRGVDRTDLRLHYRVKHRLDELDDLRACLNYVKDQDVATPPEQTIQTNAFRLLQIMDEATRGVSTPVYLGEIHDLGMGVEEAKISFNYLREKGLIRPSNLAYAGWVSAAGHDALANARKAPDKTSLAFPSITYNYYMNGRDMTITRGSVYNNINVTNSAVGAINTGNVEKIDVSLTHLHNAGRDDAKEALKALTEAIFRATIPENQKGELIEQVAFLSEEAAADADKRRPALVRPVLGALTQAASTISAISGAWQAAEPILRSIFGL
jgi:hypothetical protein